VISLAPIGAAACASIHGLAPMGRLAADPPLRPANTIAESAVPARERPAPHAAQDNSGQPLHELHAVVTGGGRGIGAAIGNLLVRKGARVTLLGRSLANLQQQIRRLKPLGKIQSFTADVSDRVSVVEAFNRARSTFGEVSILINNAGQTESAPFLKTDEALWQRLLAVNLTGTYLCTHAALPDMQHQGFGRIVNIASTAGLTGYPYVTAYCAAKHGVVGFTRALALELAARNITVNAVCPGYTDTDIVTRTVRNIVARTGRSEADAREAVTRFNPQHRLIRPEEVAHTVMWLCLPGTESITGQTIAVAGGEILT
jgi:NAD(P)-dependent dehydrogenase (short-subunit alcohol dehydrogenase family)